MEGWPIDLWLLNFRSSNLEDLITADIFSPPCFCLLLSQMDPVQKAVINHTFGVPLVKTKRPVISCNVCQIRFNSEVEEPTSMRNIYDVHENIPCHHMAWHTSHAITVYVTWHTSHVTYTVVIKCKCILQIVRLRRVYTFTNYYENSWSLSGLLN